MNLRSSTGSLLDGGNTNVDSDDFTAGLDPETSNGAANDELQCDICYIRFGSKGGLVTHQRMLHGRCYRCTECSATSDRTYSTKKAFVKHFVEAHQRLPEREIMKYMQVHYKNMDPKTTKTQIQEPVAGPSNALVPVQRTFTPPPPIHGFQQALLPQMPQVTNDKKVITAIGQVSSLLSTGFNKLEQLLQPFRRSENPEQLHNLRKQNKEYEGNWTLLQGENTALKAALQAKVGGSTALKLIEDERTITMLKLQIDQLKERQAVFLKTRRDNMEKHHELLTTLEENWKQTTKKLQDYERQLKEAKAKIEVLEQDLERARNRIKRKDDINNYRFGRDSQNKKMKFLGQEDGRIEIKNEPEGEGTVEIKTESGEPEGKMDLGTDTSRGELEEGELNINCRRG